MLLRLARLVTLAGLVSAFSSNWSELGILRVLATTDRPSLIVVAAGGAS